jgi:dolichol-phosphate mannosyltransferase
MTTNLKDKILNLKGPIFVFGASGFIGVNLFKDIFSVRKDVYALTHDAQRVWRLKLINVPSENIIHCDIVSKYSVDEVFENFQPQTVFNLAAYGACSKQKDATLTYETNVLGTHNILESLEQNAVYVHAGSSSEYGYNCSAPKEADALQPNSHYSVSKVSAAYMIQYYARFFEKNAINLRLYAIYGDWEEPDRLIPQLIEKARKDTLPNFVSPDISRDFVHITDCVEAFVDSALQMRPEIRGNSYNIGSGVKTTMKQLVDITKNAFNIAETPNWGSMPNRKWDLAEWYGDPTEATKDLGWQAKISLHDGLSQYFNWQESINYEENVLPAFKNPYLNPVITAIIACYKDAQAIPFMYERLVKTFNQMKVRYEIIFVNDCSPDNTQEVLNSICEKDQNVIAITHSRNFGSQAAFMSGMEISTGDAVVLMDGDLQDPPEVMPAFYEKWMEGNEVVYGVRVKREMKPQIHFFYRLFYRIFQALSYIKIPKDAGDFSMIDRKVVKELVNLPETEQFLRGLRAWVGFKQIGVNYVRPERMFGVSTNNWAKNIWWAKKAIFSFSFAPLEVMSYAGFIFTGLSFLGAFLQVILTSYFPDIPRGIPTIITLVLFFGGINLLGISFLGEYIGKIFEETKKRPKFIRTAVRKGVRRYNTSEEIKTFIKTQRK